jgi:4-hydroxy-3-methylbut-2-enyl diphosphate reductase IspH
MFRMRAISARTGSRAHTVGITAGTSTPDSVIAEVEHWLVNYASRLPAADAGCAFGGNLARSLEAA